MAVQVSPACISASQPVECAGPGGFPQPRLSPQYSPVQPGSHVAVHESPVVSVPTLQPEVCGGEGAGPLLHGKGSHFFPVPPGPYPLLPEQLA